MFSKELFSMKKREDHLLEQGRSLKPGDQYYDSELGVIVHIVEDTSAQRWALQTRAYSAEGKAERFISRVPARVRPTTIARLRLLEDDPYYGFPLLDEVVDEAIHDYLVRMGY